MAMVFLTKMQKIGILETKIPNMKVATIYFLPVKRFPQMTSTNQTTSPSSGRIESRTTIDEASQFME